MAPRAHTQVLIAVIYKFLYYISFPIFSARWHCASGLTQVTEFIVKKPRAPSACYACLACFRLQLAVASARALFIVLIFPAPG